MPRWDRPEAVTIRGCRIEGSVRVWGMGLNGQGEAVKASSHALGHTERAQAAAPARVSLLESTLTGRAGVPLYLWYEPGCSYPKQWFDWPIIGA